MKAHRVIVLGVVAAVALGAALWSSQTRRPVQEDAASTAVVPGLQAALNEVSEVRIRTAGDVLQATLRRSDAGWTLLERDAAPVDVSRLREFLLKLAAAKRVEAKTDKPALYFKLGVEDITTADTPGVQLDLDGLAQPVKLIVGRNVPRGSGTYVRHAGEAQSWQVDADLAVEKNPANWLDRDLIDIAAGRIESVEITPATGPRIRIVDAADGAAGDFALADLPRGREAASDFVADAAAGFLASLRFDDVLRAADAEPPAEGVTRASFFTLEGLRVDVTLWSVGDKPHAQFAAALDNAKAQAYAAAAQAKAAREHEAAKAAPAAADAGAQSAPAPASDALAVSDPAADRAARVAALEAELAAVQARVTDKTFVLPSFKTANVTKPLEDFLKPRE
jgi:hypothetical protein